jgi:phosphopantothenoylcysteine decarboxylase/phosphopantothenate--cysteine ligase
VVLTDAAQKFITPLTFQALIHRPVYTDIWTIPEGENIPHITLADNCDLLLFAPATANTIGKLANGLADNLLTAIALATRAPILLAPAMETDMWQHRATQANVETLRDWGVGFAGPAKGRLASGAEGEGRMVEPDEIVDVARALLGKNGPLAGKHVVVTAGGTREAIDPVRFITNRSSGKMGYALAEVARDRGATVTLITSATLREPANIKIVRVSSAEEMYRAVLEATPQADVLIMAAAVADYRPANVATQKIKKKEGGLVLQLERTRDILAEMASRKTAGQRGPTVTVGFAAETENLTQNAQEKLERKKLDFIVANDVTATDAGFGVDTNRVAILGRDQLIDALPLMSKFEVAEKLFDRIESVLN